MALDLDSSLRERVIVKNTFLEVVSEVDEDDWLVSPSLVRQLSDSALYTPQMRAPLGTREPRHYILPKKRCSSEVHSVCAESDVSTAPDELCVRSRCASSHFSEADQSDSESVPGHLSRIGDCTTLMIRNIPPTYSQKRFKREVDNSGFGFTYDFLYLPIQHKSKSSRGFAFMNFITAEDAEAFYREFHGRRLDDMDLDTELVITTAELQGFEANAAKYLQSRGNRRKKHDSFCEPIFFPMLSHDSRIQRDPGNQESRFCPFCGKRREIPEAKFCGYCGETVEGY